MVFRRNSKGFEGGRMWVYVRDRKKVSVVGLLGVEWFSILVFGVKIKKFLGNLGWLRYFNWSEMERVIG